MIFKLIFYTHKWELTITTTPSQSEPGNNGNKEVLFTRPDLELHHQIQFRILYGFEKESDNIVSNYYGLHCLKNDVLCLPIDRALISTTTPGQS